MAMLTCTEAARADAPEGDPMALHLTLEGADSEADSYGLIKGADVYVAPSALVELGLTAFAVDLRPLVSLAGAPGLAYVYDPASGTVRITCAAQCYATQTIGRARAPAPPARTDPGAFLNIDSAFTDIEDRGEIAAAFELGVFGRSGFGESTWTASVRDNLQAVRLETRWTMDDEPRRIRYRIGDSVARPGATADAYRFAGLQIARDFHLDPGFVTVPTPTLTGVATAPSVVDLYVDGALRLRDRVEAGPFTIVDPPVVNGLGQARVVVTDVLGRQQVISQNFYAGREMLRPGLSDFSVALGALRENFGYRSADYGRGAFSALYRRGLTAALTADVRADIAGGDGGVAVGGSWTPADVGQFDATVARSFGREGGGYARLGWSRAGAAHSMSVDLESAADGFRRVGSGWSSPRTRFAAAAGASSRRYGSVSVSATHADLRDAADLATVGIDYAPSLSTFGTIGFSLLYASSDKESVTATLSLVAALGETRSVSQAVTAENGHPYVGRANLSTIEIGRIMAEHLKSRTDIKRISIISPDYEYGQHFAQDFLAAIKVARPDITIVRQEWPKFGAADFAPHVTALQSQPVDMIVTGLFGADLVNFLRSARDFGLFKNKTEMMTHGLDLAKMGALKDSLPENTVGTVWYPFYAINTPRSKAFAAEVEKRMKTYATGSAPVGYVAGRMLVEAIKKAGTAEDTTKVSAALADIQFDGPTGLTKVRGCDNTAFYNFYVGRVKRDASLPDGIGVTDIKAYNTESVARTCVEVLRARGG